MVFMSIVAVLCAGALGSHKALAPEAQPFPQVALRPVWLWCPQLCGAIELPNDLVIV